jgi:tryptophanyl-tRNA synthetase
MVNTETQRIHDEITASLRRIELMIDKLNQPLLKELEQQLQDHRSRRQQIVDQMSELEELYDEQNRIIEYLLEKKEILKSNF